MSKPIIFIIHNKFQSTLSARRATNIDTVKGQTPYYFNPRSPRGERPLYTEPGDDYCNISIHALREESDIFHCLNPLFVDNFNPRSPRGERLVRSSSHLEVKVFQSTLSARRATLFYFRHFYPTYTFQSTLSARRATSCCQLIPRQAVISIHALREESDTTVDVVTPPSDSISIHALREESDV